MPTRPNDNHWSSMPDTLPSHLTEEEKAFLKSAQRLARDVSAMSDEQVADYIIDNDLQALVAPDRVNAVFAAAIAEAGQAHRFYPAPKGAHPPASREDQDAAKPTETQKTDRAIIEERVDAGEPT